MSATPDPEILELFRAELDAHLPVLSNGLLAMEKGGVAAADVEAMMRAAHSIKGAARIVGMDPVVRVAHVIEDCFSAAKKNAITLTSEAVDILLEGVDALQQICSPEPGAATPAIDALIVRLGTVRDGRAAAAPAPAPLATRPVASGSPRVVLPAVLDDAAAELLRQDLLAIEAGGAARVELDCAALRRLSASGLALLIEFARSMAHFTPPRGVSCERVPDELRPLWRVAALDARLQGGRH